MFIYLTCLVKSIRHWPCSYPILNTHHLFKSLGKFLTRERLVILENFQDGSLHTSKLNWCYRLCHFCPIAILVADAYLIATCIVKLFLIYIAKLIVIYMSRPNRLASIIYAVLLERIILKAKFFVVSSVIVTMFFWRISEFWPSKMT